MTRVVLALAGLICVGTTGLAPLALAQAPATKAATPTAAELVNQAITTMGGEAVLRGIHALSLGTVGHTFALEQSERPEGPWLTSYQQGTEVRDFDHHRTWSTIQRRNWVSPDWSTAQVTVSTEDASGSQFGTRWVPAGPLKFDDAMALNPERLLLTARAAADLRVLPDDMEQKVKQHVVGFTFQGKKIRLSLNPWTHLPTMLEVVAYTPTWGPIWGDVTERRWYSFWTLEKGGLMYPRQTTTEMNGQPYADVTVQLLTVDPVVDDAKFALPDDIKQASAKGNQTPRPMPAIDESKVIALTDSIVELPGGFNVTLVKQADGLVVIEGTTTPSYSQLVMAYAAKRFPGVPIKALVTTSDAWPHIGGVREYVAKGIPIYPLDLNVSILSRMASAPRTMEPDTLAKAPKAPVFHPVSERTTLGTGDTRMELIPIRGEVGERMMVIWFPVQHLLYTSDSIQRQGKGFFMPEMLQEIQWVVDREHLAGVDRVFGMHLTPTAWTDVTAAIAAAKGVSAGGAR